MTAVENRHSFSAELWEHEEGLADDVEERHGADAGGFASLRVEVTIGSTTWRTSLFHDNKRATYLLPVKKQVRVREGLDDGAPVDVTITVLI